MLVQHSILQVRNVIELIDTTIITCLGATAVVHTYGTTVAPEATIKQHTVYCSAFGLVSNLGEIQQVLSHKTLFVTLSTDQWSVPEGKESFSGEL